MKLPLVASVLRAWHNSYLILPCTARVKRDNLKSELAEIGTCRPIRRQLEKSAIGGYRCKSRIATPLTKQCNQNDGCSESKLRSCGLRQFNLARQDLQNTSAAVSEVKRTDGPRACTAQFDS